MNRRNGIPSRVRVVEPESPEVGGRTHCRRCGVMLPRGADRPYCIDDSPYVQQLLRELARHEGSPEQAIVAA